MLEVEAERLAARYKNTWRTGGPHTEELHAHLLMMDAGTVGTALIRLQRSEQTAPSIARIWSEYNALHTPAIDPLPCPDCDNTGWTTSHTDQAGYRYAKPCHCTHGDRAARLNMERNW